MMPGPQISVDVNALERQMQSQMHHFVRTPTSRNTASEAPSGWQDPYASGYGPTPINPGRRQRFEEFRLAGRGGMPPTSFTGF